MIHRYLAILCVRNEASFLLEWLAHHRACGFTDFLVFSNDCQDGTDAMLDRLQDMGALTHIRNDGPYHAKGIQFTALDTAADLPIVQQSDWIMALDVDEFVNIHVGDHSIQSLTQALPDATAITLTWRLFGNNGVARFEDRPVTEQFTHAAPKVLYWPWRAVMFKTLYRNDGIYTKPGVHRPLDPAPDRLSAARWFDCEGRELPVGFKTNRVFSDYGRANYAMAQLNHYPLGSMENFLVKADRGRAVHTDQTLGMDYWTERNYCTDKDTSIAATAPKRAQELTRLKADPHLTKLHDQGVTWRKHRIAQLLEQEPFRALMGRMLATPPTRPIPVQAARYLIQHATHAQSKATSPRRKP